MTLQTRMLITGVILALVSSLGLGLLLLSLQRQRDLHHMEKRAQAFLEAVQVGALPLMAQGRLAELDRLVCEIREHHLENLDLVFLEVRDREGRILGHTDPLKFGTMEPGEAGSAAFEDGKARVESRSHRDQEVLVVSLPVTSGFKGLPGIRWGTVVAGFDLSEPRRAWSRAVVGALALIVIAALFAGGVTVLLLNRQVVRPIRLLTDVAARLGQGDLSARAAATGRTDELEVLGQTFNRMAEALEQQTHTLEKQVRQRTRELERTNRLLQEANEHLQRLAVTDGLTGLYNFRYLRQTIEMELHRASRQQSHLSVLMMDVDFFKKFNDRYGHPAGDRVLERIAHILRHRLRITDIPCRYGGEEFAVVLPDTDHAAACQVAEEIRTQFSREDFSDVTGEPEVFLTISVGVATYPKHGNEPDSLLKAADAALYRAKDAGRNCVLSAKVPAQEKA